MESLHAREPSDEVLARADAPAPEEAPGATVDQRSILRLQRTAGNRAVGAMLRARGAAAFGRPAPVAATIGRVRPAVQRKTNFWGDEELEPTPEEPIPSDYEPPTLQWPSNDAQAERNEPCFSAESQTMIKDGIAHADLASGSLTKMPPDIAEAVKELTAAQEQWNQMMGSPEPGNGELQAANKKITAAQERISIYVVPVNDMLNATATGAQLAAADAREAATMKTEANDTGPGDEPCFEEGQQSLIREGAELAEKGAFMLDARPPDYKKSIETIQSAAEKLGAIGGSAPGQAKLQGAVTQLNRVASALDAYLTPVVKVLADAATDIQAASSQALEASDMSIRGEYAPKPEIPEPPQ
ncbi:MAG TPA: hypothetical protein VGJ71_10870 [Candidatus Limnocylindrales bacterium]